MIQEPLGHIFPELAKLKIKWDPWSSYRSTAHAEMQAPPCGGFHFIEYHSV